MLHPSHRRTRPGLCAAATIAALITLLTLGASCGDDGDDGPTADDTTTTTAKSTTSSSTTVPPEKLPQGHFIELVLPDGLTAEEKEVAEAYRDALEAFARALRDPTAEHPALDELHTGQALDAVQGRVQDFIDAGEATRLPDGGQITFEVIDANVRSEEAGMIVCLDDDSEAYSATTGDATSQEGADPHQVVVVLVNKGGRWRLSESMSRTDSTGKDRPCAIGA